MTATVSVQVRKAQEVLRVPAAALRFRPEGFEVPRGGNRRGPGAGGPAGGAPTAGGPTSGRPSGTGAGAPALPGAAQAAPASVDTRAVRQAPGTDGASSANRGSGRRPVERPARRRRREWHGRGHRSRLGRSGGGRSGRVASRRRPSGPPVHDLRARGRREAQAGAGRRRRLGRPVRRGPRGARRGHDGDHRDRDPGGRRGARARAARLRRTRSAPSSSAVSGRQRARGRSPDPHRRPPASRTPSAT